MNQPRPTESALRFAGLLFLTFACLLLFVASVAADNQFINPANTLRARTAAPQITTPLPMPTQPPTPFPNQQQANWLGR
jgi:hypothetical protein